MSNRDSTSPNTETLPYDLAEQLRTPEERAANLDAWPQDFPDDVTGIARALRGIARAEEMTEEPV